MPPAKITVPAAVLSDVSTALLTANGVDPAHAAAMTEVFLWANLRGVDSHGIARLPRYVEMFASGEANRSPRMSERLPRPGLAVLHADHAPGAVAMRRAVDMGIGLARTQGVAWVQVVETVHSGAIGAYAERAARAGMVGIVLLAGMPNMAWPGARGAAVATSPIAIGVPAGETPFLLDMATAMIALGKIKQHELKGLPLPEGVAVTAEGVQTTDPTLAKMPLPLGGMKGAGLSLGFELLTSVMAGVPVVAPVHARAEGAKRHRQNAVVIVVDPAALGDPAEFRALAAQTLDAIRGLPPLGDDPVSIPGDRGGATARRLATEGITLPGKVVEELNALAAAAGLDLRLI